MQLTVVEKFIIPKARGRAFSIAKGQIFRVKCIEGPQVADMNIFNAKNPKERFSSSFTRIAVRPHLTTGDQLWSPAPFFRPMVTIVADTVGSKRSRRGAISHDLLFARCNRKFREWLMGSKQPNCHDNLGRAIRRFGLSTHDVHDAFNIFMRTGIDRKDRLFFEKPLAKKGDYMDLRAEMDCLVAVSACPGKSSGGVHHPLAIEIFEVAKSHGERLRTPPAELTITPPFASLPRHPVR